MPDYQKSKIYKLWSPSKNLVYYGSTTQAISQRFNEHISRYKKYTENNNYCGCTRSFEILKYEDYKIELIEDYPCNNKQQLLKKEAEYIKNNNCVNKEIPLRTKKEWEQDNKELIKKKRKIYDNERKEQVKEKNESKKEERKIYMKTYYQQNKAKF
jgi:predicted ATP-dependent protease